MFGFLAKVFKARIRRSFSKGAVPQRLHGKKKNFRPALEVLEDRTTPAVSTSFSGGILTVSLSAVNDSAFLAVTAPNTVGVGTRSGTYNVSTTPGVTDIVLRDTGTNAGQAATFEGFNTFTLSGGLSSTGVETVSFFRAVDASSGSAAISVNAATNINVSGNLTGGSGGVSLTGGSATVATMDGIDVNATVSASGPVQVIGTGGSGGSGLDVGVNVAAKITSTGTGSGATVTVQGTGGPSGGDKFGVYVDGGSITSSGGAVLVTGTGGGTTSDNYGVFLGNNSSATMSSTGTGSGATVTVQGTGGGSVLSENLGVVVGVGAQITSSGGAVQVTGTGGVVVNTSATISNTGTGAAATINVQGNASGTSFVQGVLVFGGTISGGAAGTVTVQGVGSNGSRDFGVEVITGGKIISSGAAIQIIGTDSGTPQTGVAQGVDVENSGTISTGGSGNLTITTDGFNTDGTATIKAGAAGTGTVNLLTKTAGTLIDLGGSDVLSGSPLTLGLNETELSNITAGTLNIGNTSSGSVNVSAAITRASSTDINVTTGGNINFASGNSGSLNADGGNVTLNAASGSITTPTGVAAVNYVTANTTTVHGKVAPGGSPGEFSVSGNLVFDSADSYAAELNGTTVGTQYDQIEVAGTATLGNATLDVSLGYTPANGTQFVLLHTTGGVSGTFRDSLGNALAEGAAITVAGQRLVISYVGGAGGKDVVLTVQNALVNDLTVVSPTVSTNENASATGNVLTGASDSEHATISAVAGTFATTHGRVTIAANGSYTYTPTPGYSGRDSFGFTATTSDDSTSGTVTVTVNASDDLTVASPTASTNEGVAKTGNVLSGAVDSESAAIAAVAGTFATTHGRVTIAANGSYTYTPSAGYYGRDSFGFTATTSDDSTSGTVTVTVNASDDLTVASPTVSTNEGVAKTGNVLTGASDSEHATISAVAGTFATTHGRVTIAANGSYTYTPTAGYHGRDSFRFTATTSDDSTSGTVTVTVNPVNDLTVASPTVTVNENANATGNVLTGASDSEHAAIAAVAGTFATAHGRVTIAANGSYTYTPTPGYSGRDSFRFTATTSDDSTSGTVTVNVLKANQPGAPSSITATAGTPQRTTVGTAFTTALKATVTDKTGNPVSGVSVTFTAPATGASGTFSNGPTSITVTTNASGIATATFVANHVTGTYNVTAVVASTNLKAASFSLTNNPGVPGNITVISGNNQSTTIGTKFPQPVQVQVTDQYGNPLSGVSVHLYTTYVGAYFALGTFNNGLTYTTVATNAAGLTPPQQLTANMQQGDFFVYAEVDYVDPVSGNINTIYTEFPLFVSR